MRPMVPAVASFLRVGMDTMDPPSGKRIVKTRVGKGRSACRAIVGALCMSNSSVIPYRAPSMSRWAPQPARSLTRGAQLPSALSA